LKSARHAPEQNHPIPQVRLVPPRKPLSQAQHLLFGLALIMMLLILLILAFTVRQWQENFTQETTPLATVETDPLAAIMDDITTRAVLNPAAIARGGHLVVGIDEPITRINPLYAIGNGEHDAAALIFESLVQFDETMTPGLELADSFAFMPNEHQMVFKLRTDHFFRDGRAVEARDVAFTYKLLLANSYDGQLNGYFSAISSVKTDPTDPRQVIFQLADWVTKPDMAWFTVGILKSDAYSVDLARVYTLGLKTPPPEGSGPFELTAQTADKTTLTLRQGFAGEITVIDFQHIDSAEKFTLLKSGAIDIAYNTWDARLKERLDELPSYTWKKFNSTAAYALVNRTAGGSSVLQSTAQQDAVFAALDNLSPANIDPTVLSGLAASQLNCYFYRGIDDHGTAENRSIAEQAMQPLIQLGLPIDFVAADWPDLASRALEGRYDLMVIPTPANERLPATSVMLKQMDTGVPIRSANTFVAAFKPQAILVSRRLKQVTLNEFSRPLSVSQLSWTDRVENIRYLKQDG
jgi:hypothetical protein